MLHSQNKEGQQCTLAELVESGQTGVEILALLLPAVCPVKSTNPVLFTRQAVGLNEDDPRKVPCAWCACTECPVGPSLIVTVWVAVVMFLVAMHLEAHGINRQICLSPGDTI